MTLFNKMDNSLFKAGLNEASINHEIDYRKYV